MKKLIAVTLALVMVACLCSCGGNKTAGVVKKNFNKAVDYAESIMDTDGMTSSVRDTSDGVFLTKFWKAEDLDSDINIIKDVDIEGHTITLGVTTIGEIKAMGFEILSGYEVLLPGETASIGVSLNGKFLGFDTDVNETGETLGIDDMTLSAFVGETEENNLPFNYRGLTAGSTMQEVIDTLGSPNYAASLSTGETGTDIALDYLFEGSDGSVNTSVSLTVGIRYDAESDSSVLNELQIDCVYNKTDSQTTAQTDAPTE